MVQLRNGGEPKEWLDSETLTAQEMDFLVHMLPKNEAPNLRERSRSPKMDPKSIQLQVLVPLRSVAFDTHCDVMQAVTKHQQQARAAETKLASSLLLPVDVGRGGPRMAAKALRAQVTSAEDLCAWELEVCRPTRVSFVLSAAMLRVRHEREQLQEV